MRLIWAHSVDLERIGLKPCFRIILIGVGILGNSVLTREILYLDISPINTYTISPSMCMSRPEAGSSPIPSMAVWT